MYFTYNYDSAIISKTRANQWILELFSYSAAQKNIKIVYLLNHNIQSSKICWTV